MPGRHRDVGAPVSVDVSQQQLRHVQKDLEVALQGDESARGHDQVVGTAWDLHAGTDLALRRQNRQLPDLLYEEYGLVPEFVVHQPEVLEGHY